MITLYLALLVIAIVAFAAAILPWEDWRLDLERAGAMYLNRRGWVVFWLDPCARTCGPNNPTPPTGCWLHEFEQERARKRRSTP